MAQEEKELLLKDLCARLPYGVRGKVKADGVDTNRHDIDGFPLETTFDVDVELLRIDASNDEVFVSTFNNNEDLGNYIEECQIEGTPWTIEEFTPYLRSISSMTNEEKGELKLEQEKDEELFIRVINKSQNGDDSLLGTVIPHYAEDWANKNHFDYRGLIEKNLALDCTGLHVYD